MTPVERVLAKLPDAKQTAAGWLARCPAHEDRKPSLSISEGNDHRALLKCHAGCKVDTICAALGLRVLDLMPKADTLPPPSKSKAKASAAANGERSIVATYDYRDENGELLFEVVRYQPKDFRQRRPKGRGWDWSVKGVRVVPYRLQELLADPECDVVVAEGEKDVDNLAKIGVLATCNAGGAEKWTPEHAEFLRGRRVVILPDNDDAGERHSQRVAESLHGIAEWVRIVKLPDLPHKGDASDWMAAGGTKADLDRLVKATANWNCGDVPWPEISRFDVLDLPSFPTEVLPEPLRSWVREESIATQTPADLAGLLALAVCSAALARRVDAAPRPGWREPVNLFVAILLGPGNRKSAVFADATRPLRELEAALIEAARATVARSQSERRQLESQLRRLEQAAAAENDAQAKHEALSLSEALASRAEPALPQLIADDATGEKLGMMLAEQGGRMASMSPEGGVFDLMKGQYSKSGLPEFTIYLKGHAGDDLNTDRVSRKSVRVERPALTCAYAIQPSVIEGLAENPAFRGRGLLARFLYAFPRSWLGEREVDPPPVTDATREAYGKLIRRLAEVEGEHTLALNSDAFARFHAWQQEIEDMLADGGRMELIADWGAKLAGATARLASVLHCVQHGTMGDIDYPTVTAAIEIARFLIPHADAVLNMMDAKEGLCEQDARYVLAWIIRRGLRDFTKSEGQHHGKRRFPQANLIDGALGELQRRGYIRLRRVEATGPGRPASPVYDVNPAFEFPMP